MPCVSLEEIKVILIKTIIGINVCIKNTPRKKSLLFINK